MADIPVEIVERIRREPQPGLNVVAGSTPVVFFGEQPSASVATLGINPSSAEFVVRDESLTGERQRFETLDSLGISSMAEASDEHVKAVHERCLYYFRDPDTGQAPRPTTYWRWFQPLEDIIRPLRGASYLDGTACHLDLVQWATAPVWGKLTRQVQEALLYQDRDFLRWQLGAPQLELVYLNGDAVHRQFRSVLPEASVRECPMHSTDGELKATFYGGWYGRTMVVGTSYYIQNGRARGPRANVQAWIMEVLRQIIARLEEEGPEGDLKALCDG